MLGHAISDDCLTGVCLPAHIRLVQRYEEVSLSQVRVAKHINASVNGTRRHACRLERVHHLNRIAPFRPSRDDAVQVRLVCLSQ